MERKTLFIDRDGTIVREPHDYQVDRLDKIRFVPDVIPSLITLQKAGYRMVMVTNQDGLGTSSFPKEDFTVAQDFILEILSSQGIVFDDIYVCPHFLKDGCECRKPKTGLLQEDIKKRTFRLKDSYVIGDRETDMQLALNLGIPALKVDDGQNGGMDWKTIVQTILYGERTVKTKRKTKETDIEVSLNLDSTLPSQIQTGIGFFDHMLEQLCRYGEFHMVVKNNGDLHIDSHHSIEDVALTLGEAMREALGDKVGIERYAFVLPMDESRCELSLDLGGRSSFVLEGDLKNRLDYGLKSSDGVNVQLEMVPHFFLSFSQTLKANCHLKVVGENVHHMVEASFKALGKAIRDAKRRRTGEQGTAIPSTKGVL